MNNKLLLIFAIVILTFLNSCEKETTRTPDFFVEYATVNFADSSITFMLDTNTVLIPRALPQLGLEHGDRVIINYTPLDDEFITINSVRKIFLGNIKIEGYPNEMNNSPIKIISAWARGNYLNMSFEVDYHSKPHSTALFRDTTATKPTLHFSYSRENDPPGAPNLTYVSFNIESLQEKEFTLYVNTYDSLRIMSVERTYFSPLKQ